MLEQLSVGGGVQGWMMGMKWNRVVPLHRPYRVTVFNGLWDVINSYALSSRVPKPAVSE